MDRAAHVAFLSMWAVLAACLPVQGPEPGPARPSVAAGAHVVPASTAPADWQRVSFVSGLSVAVPPTAEVAYPQGIDSNLLEISGRGFSLNLDDHGPFSGSGTLRLAGRPVNETVRTKNDCRHRTVQIELPRRWAPMGCAPEDKRCRGPNAKVALSSLCQGAAACGTVDAVIGSTRFAPGPHAPLPRADPNRRPPEQPVCSVD